MRNVGRIRVTLRIMISAVLAAIARILPLNACLQGVAS